MGQGSGDSEGESRGAESVYEGEMTPSEGSEAEPDEAPTTQPPPPPPPPIRSHLLSRALPSVTGRGIEAEPPAKTPRLDISLTSSNGDSCSVLFPHPSSWPVLIAPPF